MNPPSILILVAYVYMWGCVSALYTPKLGDDYSKEEIAIVKLSLGSVWPFVVSLLVVKWAGSVISPVARFTLSTFRIGVPRLYNRWFPRIPPKAELPEAVVETRFGPLLIGSEVQDENYTEFLGSRKQ